ncbi:NAD(P)/FAD-dependent oxidoreductase [Streptomyces galbus]|uniref:NAD(P)/FAD-dependent oxidoreductase n=1 Tax=Streptomyces galbus TaxID=33898 RepID=UPI003EB97900
MKVYAHGVPDGGGHGHAVVIGSGLAGLAAAGALARFMDRVTVIERDWLPRGAGRRRGVPQARHTHSLPTAAHQGLEELFPGIRADLVRAGAVHLRVPEDLLLLGPAGWLPRFDAGLSLLSAGRDLLDAVVRDRLRADAKVGFLHDHDVVGLRPGPQDTVTGVLARARDRRAPGGWTPPRLIAADFVVDASGRGSHAPQWLADLGYEPPAETVVRTGATYATSLYAPPVGHVADWQGVWLMAAGDDPRQGLLHPVEGGRWSVSLSTPGTAPAPADHEQMLHAAAALRDPLLRDLLATATPLGPVYRCAVTGSRWRHYERLRRWPDQFLVVGDAFAALDPVHGDGMTLAVQGALLLERMLTAHGTAVGITYRLRRALAHQRTRRRPAMTAPRVFRPPGASHPIADRGAPTYAPHMTAVHQRARTEAHLRRHRPTRTANTPPHDARWAPRREHPCRGNSQLARETPHLPLESRLSAVVRAGRTWLAFHLLQGTDLLAPRQAAPTADRSPVGPGVPMTAQRRGEGARV